MLWTQKTPNFSIIAGILGYSDVGLLVVKEYLHYILTKFKIISWSQYTVASMITSLQAVLAGFCKSSLVTGEKCCARLCSKLHVVTEVFWLAWTWNKKGQSIGLLTYYKLDFFPSTGHQLTNWMEIAFFKCLYYAVLIMRVMYKKSTH